MAPDLTERDEERFTELRDRLAGVERAEREHGTPPRPGPIDPMLATTFTGDLDTVPDGEFLAERKFDGTRIVAEKFDGVVSLYTRRHVERSETLPELARELEVVLPDGTILDCEFAFLTPEGVSRFVPIHTATETVEEENLDGVLFVFDILAVAGEWTTREPLDERKAILDGTIPSGDSVRVTAFRTDDFQTYYDDLVATGEEGIMLKRRSSIYHVGTRSDHWQKVKAFTERDVLVVGYTIGKGRRAETFGALVMTDGKRYIGKVGTGFDDAELLALIDEMEEATERAVPVSTVGEAYVPVEPLVVQVKYQAITRSGDLRAPVFLQVREDKPVADVEPIK